MAENETVLRVLPHEAIDLVRQFLRQGRLNDARRICDQLRSMLPLRGDVLHLAGRAAMGQGAGGQAVQLLKMAIALAPSDSTIYADLAIVCERRGEFDSALVDRFDGIALERFAGLAPGIEGASIFACTVAESIEQHTHTIVTGHVAHVVTARQPPLLYHRAAYGRFVPAQPPIAPESA